MLNMGLVRAYISDDLEKAMRNLLPARRGAISEFIEQAIREKLEKMGIEVQQ